MRAATRRPVRPGHAAGRAGPRRPDANYHRGGPGQPTLTAGRQPGRESGLAVRQCGSFVPALRPGRNGLARAVAVIEPVAVIEVVGGGRGLPPGKPLDGLSDRCRGLLGSPGFFVEVGQL